MYKIGRENKKRATPAGKGRRGAGGKPEKLRTKEIKLMSFLEGEPVRDLAVWRRGGTSRGKMLCFSVADERSDG